MIVGPFTVLKIYFSVWLLFSVPKLLFFAPQPLTRAGNLVGLVSCRPSSLIIYYLDTEKSPVNSPESYSLVPNVSMAKDRQPWGPVV